MFSGSHVLHDIGIRLWWVHPSAAPVAFVQTFPRWLSGASCPSSFHSVMRFLFFFFSFFLGAYSLLGLSVI